MAFDRTEAQLDENQLDLAEVIDTIYEQGDAVLADGFQFSDLLVVPGLAPAVLKLVELIGGAATRGELIRRLNGAQAAFVNDNIGEWINVELQIDEEGDGA